MAGTRARTASQQDREVRVMAPRGRAADRSERVDLAAQRTRIRSIVAPVIGEAGSGREELSVARAGRRHVVRVIVDGDAGVNLDAIAVISRTVSGALDEAERSGGELAIGEYTLEVSSPGVDRPLTQARHWRRNIGRLVKVKAGDRQVTGRIAGVDGGAVTLELETGPSTLELDHLGPGHVQVEFARLDEVSDEDLDEFTDADEVDADEADENPDEPEGGTGR